MMNINHITLIPNCTIICSKLLLLKIWSFKDSYSPASNTYFVGSASSTRNKIRNVMREWNMYLGITIFFLSHIDQNMIPMVHFTTVMPWLLLSHSMTEAMIAPHDHSGSWDLFVEIVWEIEKVFNEKATPVDLNHLIDYILFFG